MRRSILSKTHESYLPLVDPKVIGPVAFRVIHELQYNTPAERLVGSALAFKLMCEKLDIHPGNVIAVVDRILSKDSPFWAEVRAAREYVRNEVE